MHLYEGWSLQPFERRRADLDEASATVGDVFRWGFSALVVVGTVAFVGFWLVRLPAAPSDVGGGALSAAIDIDLTPPSSPPPADQADAPPDPETASSAASPAPPAAASPAEQATTSPAAQDGPSPPVPEPPTPAEKPDIAQSLPPPVVQPPTAPPPQEAAAEALPPPSADPAVEGPRSPVRPAAAGQPSRAEARIIASWQRLLITRLERAKHYPAEAHGVVGTATVRFSIDRQGHLLHSEIASSSGSRLLDAETLALIARSQPFPSPPPSLADKDLTFTVPIRYQRAGDD